MISLWYSYIMACFPVSFKAPARHHYKLDVKHSIYVGMAFYQYQYHCQVLYNTIAVLLFFTWLGLDETICFVFAYSSRKKISKLRGFCIKSNFELKMTWWKIVSYCLSIFRNRIDERPSPSSFIWLIVPSIWTHLICLAILNFLRDPTFFIAAKN